MNPPPIPEPIPERLPCPQPADLAAEIAAFDREAERGRWEGPRYRAGYRIKGDGPPLLIVRGISGSIAGFALLVNRLAERFRTVLYDYPGDDPTDGAELRSITHEDLAEDVSGLLDHLGIGRSHLFGISFGTTVALRALHREPRRFPKAVLQGAFAHRPLARAERLALRFGRLVPGPSRNLPLHRRIITYNSAGEFPAILADRWPIFLEHTGGTPIAALAHRVALLSGLDLRPILPEIATPILAVYGRDDRIVPIRELLPLRVGLPDLSATILPGGGHQLHYTHGEWLARTAGEFLGGCEASCALAAAGQCSGTAEAGDGHPSGPSVN